MEMSTKTMISENKFLPSKTETSKHVMRTKLKEMVHNADTLKWISVEAEAHSRKWFILYRHTRNNNSNI